MAKAREAAERAEGSLQKMAARYGSIDLDEYNRVKEELAQAKVGWGMGRRGLLTQVQLSCRRWQDSRQPAGATVHECVPSAASPNPLH